MSHGNSTHGSLSMSAFTNATRSRMRLGPKASVPGITPRLRSGLLLVSWLTVACGSESTSPIVDSDAAPSEPPAPFVVPAVITAWLNTEVIPFEGSHLDAELSDWIA